MMPTISKRIQILLENKSNRKKNKKAKQKKYNATIKK